MTDNFSTTAIIQADQAAVWKALTDPEIMVRWLGEPEMQIKVQADWKVNGLVYITGFHHKRFENKGVVLTCDKEEKLVYTYLSSLSRLADSPGNYSIFEFSLQPMEKQTLLTVNISNFPTETIRKHLAFYWRTTVFRIKQIAEGH